MQISWVEWDQLGLVEPLSLPFEACGFHAFAMQKHWKLAPTAVNPSQKYQFYRPTSDVTCPVSDDSATTEEDVCKSMVSISWKVFMWCRSYRQGTEDKGPVALQLNTHHSYKQQMHITATSYRCSGSLKFNPGHLMQSLPKIPEVGPMKICIMHDRFGPREPQTTIKRHHM